MKTNDMTLPPEPIQRITQPLARFLKIESATGAVLLLATIAALVVSNSVWSEGFLAIWELPVGFKIGSIELTRSLKHWINDGLMTLFFFVVALELKRELILGELRSMRMAAMPLAGAIGGMLFPAVLFLAVIGNHPERHGWGTAMATDTAFVIGCLALLGSRIPASLRLFLLSLAIFDDIGAILVVTFGYGQSLNWMALTLAFVGFALVAGAARVGARSIPVYSFLGIAIWMGFDASGLHPTIAGVVLGLMTPTYGWVSDQRLRSLFGKVLSYPEGDHWSGDTADRRDLQQASAAAKEALSPVERIEIRLHPWVGFVIMPVFALANAGVVVSTEAMKQPVSLAIIAALALGKPLGVFCMSWVAVRLGVATLFSNLNWPLIAAGSLLTGIGFTMSLFIAGLAFSPSSLVAAKIGILTASAVSALAGVLTLTWLTSRKSTSR